MSLASITLNQILIILVIIIIGFLCYKTKLIDDRTNSKLSDILLMLVNPMVILVSYQQKFSIELLNGLLLSFLFAILTHLFSILVSYQVFRKKRKKKTMEEGETRLEWVEYSDAVVERISIIYTNCGFMGIPLVNGVFGSEGVFYVTAYITIFNVFLWTQGVIMMTGSKGLGLKDLLKKLISPTIIAIIIGILLFLFQIKLPSIMFQAFDYIAQLNTPFAMLIAGVTIGKTNIKDILKNYRIYVVAIIRLLLIPILLLLIYSRFPINEVVLVTSVLMAACPSAATGILFSIRYEKNAIYASELFAVTTILCCITIPLVVSIAELLI